MNLYVLQELGILLEYRVIFAPYSTI